MTNGEDFDFVDWELSDDPNDEGEEISAEELENSAQQGDAEELDDGLEDSLVVEAEPQSMAPDFAAMRAEEAGIDHEEPAPHVDRSLERQLSGEVPLFVIHKSHQLSGRLPEAARVAQRVTQGRVGVAVAIRLPRATPANGQKFLRNFQNCAVRIADPELFCHPAFTDSPASPAAAAKDFAYMASMPSSPDGSWASSVLEAQRAAGATALLSASGWVSDRNAHQSLLTAMRWVYVSREAVGPSTPMFVNLTLSSSWLSDPRLRALLLEELVESNERLWWLRFYWPIVEPRYGQLRDPAILNGYKELCVTASLEGKALVLPNTGLTGWIATALGAAGFSTGTGWPEQAFAAQRVMGSRKGQARAQVTRYFERSVLHTLDHASHVALMGEPGYLQCRCRFCQSIGASQQSLANWDKESAGMHYLVRAARLMDLLSGPNRRVEALREVNRALSLVGRTSGRPASLTGAASPQHLTLWRSLLL